MAVSHNSPTQQETPETMTAMKRPTVPTPAKRFNPSEIEEREYTDIEFAELAKLYDNTFGRIQEGEIIAGKIVAITDSPAR